MGSLFIIGALIVITIFVIAAISYTIPTGQYKNALNGYWVANKDFLDQSGYDQVEMYIDGSRGYLVVMESEDAYIVDNEITITTETFRPSVIESWLSPDSKYCEYPVLIKDGDPVIPSKKITAKHSLLDGSLVLYSGKDIHLVLYRDNIASSAAKLAKNDSN